jgi:hypothetical protein
MGGEVGDQLDERIKCAIGDEETEGRDEEERIAEANAHKEHACVEHDWVLIYALQELLSLGLIELSIRSQLSQLLLLSLL